jgi:hypothetical protein
VVILKTYFRKIAGGSQTLEFVLTGSGYRACSHVISWHPIQLTVYLFWSFSEESHHFGKSEASQQAWK